MGPRTLQAHPPPLRSGSPRAAVPTPPTQTWEPIDDRRPKKPTQQEMDIFKQQEMSKSRPQSRANLINGMIG